VPTGAEVDVGFNPDRTATIRIAGEITAATQLMVRNALDRVAGRGPVIVDLTAVTHLDTTGVTLLTEVAGERGLEVVMGPDCPVFSVVRVSGLADVATLLGG
jgi:anti-anti-sigma factor